MTDEDWVYHGVYTPLRGEPELTCGRILVEKIEYGPAQRENAEILRELTVTYGKVTSAGDQANFEWGYDGGGPYRTAAAVLADALNLGAPEAAGMAWWASATSVDDTLRDLCLAFRQDVISQCAEEWRVTRRVVLAWARDWYRRRGIDDVPAILSPRPSLRSV